MAIAVIRAVFEYRLLGSRGIARICSILEWRAGGCPGLGQESSPGTRNGNQQFHTRDIIRAGSSSVIDTISVPRH